MGFIGALHDTLISTNMTTAISMRFGAGSWVTDAFGSADVPNYALIYFADATLASPGSSSLNTIEFRDGRKTSRASRSCGAVKLAVSRRVKFTSPRAGRLPSLHRAETHQIFVRTPQPRRRS